MLHTKITDQTNVSLRLAIFILSYIGSLGANGGDCPATPRIPMIPHPKTQLYQSHQVPRLCRRSSSNSCIPHIPQMKARIGYVPQTVVRRESYVYILYCVGRTPSDGYMSNKRIFWIETLKLEGFSFQASQSV